MKLANITIAALLLTAVIATPVAYHSGQHNHTAKLQEQATSEQSMLSYINGVRAAHQVAPLAEDKGLTQASTAKAEDMAALNYATHDRPNGEAWYNLIYQYRGNNGIVGQNLGECFTSTPALIKAWEASPEHLTNIINPTFHYFGSYTVYDTDQKCFLAVNDFAE